MSNMWVMAKKEFTDLANSRLVIIVLAFYILIFSLSFYNSYGMVYATGPDSSFFTLPAGDTLGMFTIIICYYGSLVAVVLGFSSMSGEADGKALNTLLVKPLYRDTIINGKLLGTFCFVFCIFWVSAAIYTSVLLCFFGGIIGPHLFEFLSLLPLAFVLYMLCSIFMFSLSMLICISFKEQSLALFLGFLSWILLFYIMSNMVFGGYISAFLHLDNSASAFIGHLSPYNMVTSVTGYMFLKNTVSFSLILSNNILQVFMLSLYCFVTVFASYSLFIRRDVS